MQDEQKTTNEIKEEYNFDRPSYTFIPKGDHLWRQQGYYLVCFSCELKHAVFVGKDKVMVGEKGGKPILKNRKEIGMI